MTQIDYAKNKVVTPQMQHVAQVELLPVDVIMEGVATGRIVIPANVNHKSLVPCGIGRCPDKIQNDYVFIISVE